MSRCAAFLVYQCLGTAIAASSSGVCSVNSSVSRALRHREHARRVLQRIAGSWHTLGVGRCCPDAGARLEILSMCVCVCKTPIV